MLRLAVIAVAMFAFASPCAPVVRLASAQQIDLRFTGLKDPNSVAVAANGDVYVTDAGHRRVLKLAAGSTSQNELPFKGLENLTGIAVDGGVAVDAGGSVYVTYGMDARIVKLAAG